MTAALAMNGVAWRKRARIWSISKVDLALHATPLLCGGGNEASAWYLAAAERN